MEEEIHDDIRLIEDEQKRFFKSVRVLWQWNAKNQGP